VQVKPGDTAGQIAARYRPAGVSLDQMLVAMQRANPQAFVGGNVNRLKAGAVIEMPPMTEAQGTALEEARQVIAAQSRDFNEFRRRLADAAKPQAVENERQSSGQVQAEVKEERGPAPLADKLVLSKGAVGPGSADAEAIAQQAQARDNARQLETLSSNIEALDQLKAQVPEALAAPAETASTATSSQGGVALTTNAPAVPDARGDPSARIESFIQQPWVLPVTGGLLVLLAGLGLVVSRRSQNQHRLNKASPGSRLGPDPSFETTSPRLMGTAATAPPAPPLALPWKPAPANKADPVAQADVYLAYGRDQQAEQMLRADLAAHPRRLATYLKLLDIYALRRDVPGFEVLALDAYGLTQGRGGLWAHICEKGRLLDAANPLYGLEESTGAATPFGEKGMQPDGLSPTHGVDSTDLDLDLEPEPHGPLDADPHTPRVQTQPDPVDFDFDFPPEMVAQIHASAQSGRRPQPQPDELDADFDFDETPEPPSARPLPSGPDLSLRFDWASLKLDTDAPPADGLRFDGFTRAQEPMEAQFAMAETLLSVGDVAAARAAAEAVYADANGSLKIKAARFLAKLR